MYSFVAKEVDYANYFQTVSATHPAGLLQRGRRVTAAAVSPQLIEVQAEYHRKSLALLQSVLPQIKAQQGKCLSPPAHSTEGSASRQSHAGLCHSNEPVPARPPQRGT